MAESRSFFRSCGPDNAPQYSWILLARELEKSGGGPGLQVCLDAVVLAHKERGMDLIALDIALDKLAVLDSRQSRAVELRYFGGLNDEEVAEVLPRRQQR